MAVTRKPRTTHVELAQRLLDIMREQGTAAGTRLPEQRLAELCNVSRTPVRRALALLNERGIVRRDDRMGYSLVLDLADGDREDPALPASEESELAETVLRDRMARRLDVTITIAALIKRYSKPRQAVQKALLILSDEGLVERGAGQAWRFTTAPDSPEALVESYDFRLALEPAAILSPGFRLDPARASAARLNMEALLSQSDANFDVRAYARVDDEFHRLIAGGTSNRFIGSALSAHHRLRRLAESLSSVGAHRLRQSLRDHLSILAQLEARQNETAADLLRAHLRSWRNQRPHAANRGAPPLAAAIRRPG